MADESVTVSNSAASSNPDYVVAVDTVGGKEYQRVKLDAGADGALVPIVAGQQVMAASLPVAIASNQPAMDVSVVSGTVTASAGTDLNTSALALEAGGNLAAVAASASILDDWDESDRAKVNIIVGQAGVAAGTGVDGATVQRVTLATNVALPAGNNNIGDVDVASVTGNVTVVQPTAANFNAQVSGDIAHDAADSGNPVKVGYKAVSALPTVVATGDRANSLSDLWGRQLTAHIDPTMQIRKFVSVTTQQTGTDVWTPAAGKRIAITSIVIASFGTTAARVILWFGDDADTTFTAGTDAVLIAASFAPSTTSKPGLVFCPAVPVYNTVADRELHLTTDAALSVDIAIAGYEW